MGRPGLVQKKVRVKTKRGVAMRTMWVKSNSGTPAKKGRAPIVSTAAGAKREFQKNSVKASAKYASRLGFMSGALGAHRVGHGAGSLVSAGGAHALTLAHRKASGTGGKTLGKKIKHYYATELGHGAGHLAGAAAHEGARFLAGRAMAAYSNRKRG